MVDHDPFSQFNLLDQWAQFLIEDSLIPELQLSTDDFAGRLANQTNLAIKGIVGIKAMSEIARLVGDSTRASNYSVRVSCFVMCWLGVNRLPAVDRKLVRLAVAEARAGLRRSAPDSRSRPSMLRWSLVI